MIQYQDLIERVKAATEPDRELDAELYCMDKGYDFLALARGTETYGQFATSLDDRVVNPHTRIMPGHLVFQLRGEIDPRRENRTQMMGSFTAYTASIDAALALVERCLPGWAIEQVGWGNGLVIASIGNFSSGEDYRAGLGESTTAPLAILTALLLALQSNEATNVEDK